MTNRKKLTSESGSNGQITLPFGVHMGEVSLDVPQTLDDEQIISLGDQLRRVNNAAPWWLADYLVLVLDLFKDENHPRSSAKKVYDRVCMLFPQHERGTLRELAYVARSVPAEIRSPRLSFAHHRHLAPLATETEGKKLQAHYVKKAVELEMTVEDLRLTIADTRKGVVHQLAAKPAKRLKNANVIDADVSPAGADAGDGLPIAKPPSEPETMSGSHAQLASEAYRALVRIRDWYAAERKKSRGGGDWSHERRAALIRDLEPVLDEMHKLSEIACDLTKTGEHDQE